MYEYKRNKNPKSTEVINYGFRKYEMETWNLT